MKYRKVGVGTARTARGGKETRVEKENVQQRRTVNGEGHSLSDPQSRLFALRSDV